MLKKAIQKNMQGQYRVIGFHFISGSKGDRRVMKSILFNSNKSKLNAGLHFVGTDISTVLLSNIKYLSRVV